MRRGTSSSSSSSRRRRSRSSSSSSSSSSNSRSTTGAYKPRQPLLRQCQHACSMSCLHFGQTHASAAQTHNRTGPFASSVRHAHNIKHAAAAPDHFRDMGIQRRAAGRLGAHWCDTSCGGSFYACLVQSAGHRWGHLKHGF